MNIDISQLIQFIIAIILGFGGVEGAKSGVRYLRRKNDNNNAFDFPEPTNPTIEVPITRSECLLRHTSLESEIANIKNSLSEIKQDTKMMLAIQLDVSQLRGNLETKIETIRGEIPKEIKKAFKDHEGRYKHVA